MKREFIVGCLAVALFSSCSGLGRNEQPSQSPRSSEIEKALNETVIPLVDLENVKIKDALKFWQDASRKNHPYHFQFTQMMSYPTAYALPSSQGGAQRNVATSPAIKIPNVTVRRKNITSKRLMDEICHEANLTWTIMGKVIVVKPAAAPAGSQ